MTTHLAPEHLSAWVEVDREALAHNLRQVRGFVGPEVRLLAVVKADAYGHGAIEASRVFVDAGADFLGVTRLEEAAELRDAGIAAPILVFAAGLPQQAELVVQHDVAQTICTTEAAQALSQAAGAAGRVARVHVKVDSGMGRLGVRPEALVDFLRALRALANLEVQGLYTHFATAPERKEDFFARQTTIFLRAVSAAAKAGLGNPIVHAANSAALLKREPLHLDMVRPGTVLYGQYPSANVPRPLDLHETWQLKARVVFVRDVKPGESVGYGRDFVARRRMTVAVLPLGYCDGVMLTPTRTARSLHEAAAAGREFVRRGRAGVRIRGQLAPFAGRVSMQMCSVDVTHIPGVAIGDEALVPARRTVSSARIPRLYRG